jgi:hypothetical protein
MREQRPIVDAFLAADVRRHPLFELRRSTPAAG